MQIGLIIFINHADKKKNKSQRRLKINGVNKQTHQLAAARLVVPAAVGTGLASLHYWRERDHYCRDCIQGQLASQLLGMTSIIQKQMCYDMHV